VTRANRLQSLVALLAACLTVAACVGTSPSKPPSAPPKPVAVRAGIDAQRTRPEFPGFRRVVRNEVEYFCQTSMPTGSRTRRGDQCFTRAELKRMEESNADLFKDAAGGSSHDSLKTDSPR